MAAKKEDKPYTTVPRAQEDLERRLADDHTPDSAVNEGVVLINPNPFGNEDYAGTDPIYQNHANDTEKPLRAKKGVEKKAEDAVRSLHKFSEDEEVVDDPGMGGKAVRTKVQTPVQSMVVVDQPSSPDDK